MALVCDTTSDQPPEENPDIEDGEITDDDEEPAPQEAAPESAANPATAGAQPTIQIVPKLLGNISDSDSIGASMKEGSERARDLSGDGERSDDKDRFSDGRERGRGKNREGNKMRDRGAKVDKSHRHMTEAERSILHLRKREKMARERDKWDTKHHVRRDSDPLDDDFAKNIEKTLATILHKKEKEVAALSAGEEVVEEEVRKGKKRKKEDREKGRSKKHRRMLMANSPRSEDIDENEMLNIRSGSPGADLRLMHGPLIFPPMDQKRSRSPSRSDDSYNSEPILEERLEERSRRRKITKNRKRKELKRERKEREQRRGNRDEQPKSLYQDSQGVCVFYLQGKCQKNDCPYSHEVSPPMKLELCKFYLMDCCAKGENCSYMHSEFPCKFYHTGLPCNSGKDCKFAHGAPLSDGLKQILFKHIETAPRDILQGFPRLSRDEALNLINQTQKKLTEQYSDQNTSSIASSSATAVSSAHNLSPLTQNYRPQLSPTHMGFGMYREEYTELTEGEPDIAKGGIRCIFDISVPVPREVEKMVDFDAKLSERVKTSRWQQEQDDESSSSFHMKGFNYGTDQDMRFSSNRDIDMRTLPSVPPTSEISDIQTNISPKGDVDIRNFTKDIDIRQPPFSRGVDVDIRQVPFDGPVSEDSNSKDGQKTGSSFQDFEMPQTAKDLFTRISANQKDTTIDNTSNNREDRHSSVQSQNYDDQNINWYSDDDDDDDNRLTIKVEDEDFQKKERDDNISDRETVTQDGEDSEEAIRSFLSPPEISSKTADIVGKLGDLSKIDISAEVTKLLTSMSQNKSSTTSAASPSTSAAKPESGSSPKASETAPMDPRISRQARQDPRQQDSRQDPRLTDPRRERGRQNSTESKEKDKKSEKMSIYEQGGIDMKKAALEIDSDDFRNLRPDIDLRNMSLPFKGMQNYTPATEIDASVNSHPPMTWRVFTVEIPRPDYTGLKLSINEAEKTGDPRLRKIFRLSIDEKDSPASPKASPKQGSGIRIDPRLRKMEEKVQEPKDSTPQMSYSQQLSMLQSSQFYQSLTSNQKLMLNQELAKNDQSGGGGLNDAVLNSLLNNLNLLPQASQAPNPIAPPSHIAAATSILSNVAKMNPMMPNQPIIGQQGILGAAPGIPNMPPQGMPPDFPMNFDPRGGPSILGNGPPGPGFGQFGGMDQGHSYGNNYNDDFYGGGYEDQGNMGPQGGNMGGNFRHGRGYNNNHRDGRRRGNRDGFRGGRGNRHFHKRGAGRDKMDRDRDRGRDGRGNRGHSPP
ncbi:protein suppressor of sable isoform X1 [Euwallacea fornicatus]|uniref:protein suppressor of sable isoform X1 n=1 Tax=Euwallacea fornicatus TaxID=995702 RepID=UPI00338EFDDA